MRKVLSVLAGVLFVTGIFAIPAMAREIFKAEIISCGPRGTTAACGSNPASNDPLQQGRIEVLDNGAVRVELTGAAPDTLYRVFVGNWVRGRDFQFEFRGDSDSDSIGTVTTDDAGNYSGAIATDSGDNFYFPPGTTIGQLNFAFNNPDTGQTQFTTGFGNPQRRLGNQEKQQYHGSQPSWGNEYEKFKSILPK